MCPNTCDHSVIYVKIRGLTSVKHSLEANDTTHVFCLSKASNANLTNFNCEM